MLLAWLCSRKIDKDKRNLWSNRVSTFDHITLSNKTLFVFLSKTLQSNAQNKAEQKKLEEELTLVREANFQFNKRLDYGNGKKPRIYDEERVLDLLDPREEIASILRDTCKDLHVKPIVKITKRKREIVDKAATIDMLKDYINKLKYYKQFVGQLKDDTKDEDLGDLEDE